MAGLQGGAELNRRLKAVRLAFKPIGRKWATSTRDETRRQARPHRKTGLLDRSFRFRASERRAGVYARFTFTFLDKGTKAHAIRARRARNLVFEVQGRTIFARAVHHRGQRGKGIAAKAAHKALRDNPMKDTLIDAWNHAA